VREALTVMADVAAHCDLLLNRTSTLDWTPIITSDWQAVFRPTLFPFPPSVFVYPRPGGFT
jgi:hypothetical protein